MDLQDTVMKPFHVLFGENREIQYKGKIISKCLELTNLGEYKIKFTFLESNSKLNQSIVIFLPDFVGEFYLEGIKQEIPKKRFPGFNFWHGLTPQEFTVEIKLNQGKILICNGSDLTGTRQFCRSMYMGCAMYIERIDENNYKFYCNDHELDDDFDDLIFGVEIVEYVPTN